MFERFRWRWAKAREIARLYEESRRLKQEIELLTGEPVKLTEEERAELARAAEGLDRKIVERLSAFSPYVLLSREPSESADNAGIE